jgi:hypothetical protein
MIARIAEITATAPPTWEEALAHAKALLAQGVNVAIVEPAKVVEIFDSRGRHCDHTDGTPALQHFYSKGGPKEIGHYADGALNDIGDGTAASISFDEAGRLRKVEHRTAGLLNDPPGGGPAFAEFWPGGSVRWSAHFLDAVFHDPDPQTPAVQFFYPDGSLRRTSSYTNGELVSEKSFPPPLCQI